MIVGIRGKLVVAKLTEAVIDIGGVSCRMFIPMSTYDRLPLPGQEVSLLTYMAVREDAIHLYGFFSAEEKELFEMLIGVSGIGAKLALNILSSMPAAAFCAAVSGNDIVALKHISGIGKKTAERLMIELRDKVSKMTPGFTAAAAPAVSGKKAVAAEEALLALEQLGFKRDKARKAIHDITATLNESECSSENIIRKALQTLNQ